MRAPDDTTGPAVEIRPRVRPRSLPLCSGRWLLLVVLASVCVGQRAAGFVQAPLGSIGGSVTDGTGSVLVAAAVSLVNEATAVTRRVATDEAGRYRVVALEPGRYNIEVASPGFRPVGRAFTLRVGDDLTIDVELSVGGLEQRAEVQAGTAAVNSVDYGVSGSVGRAQIEHVPLNGRSFLELAQLQPGVRVASVSNPGAFGNNYQRVLIGGAYYSQTRITVDGSTVGDRFVGGTTQGLSQESVQEFQVATFNLQPGTGLTGSGAINIVTRRGSNELRGSTFLYFRDHHLAAYPGFQRDSRSQASPFFARRQAGGSLGGPLKRDRLFWFANYERNNQDAVFNVTNNHPIFSKFDGVFANPLDGTQFNVRLDGRPSDPHQVFARFSLDHNRTVTPAVAVGLPSNWQSVRNSAFQLQAGLTSVLTVRLVNDLRLSYGVLDGDLDTITADECDDPVSCVGVDGSNILVFDAPQFRIGRQFNSPFERRQRTLQVTNNLTWQRGAHYLRAGGEWERFSLLASLAFREPAQITLWGPSNLQTPALLPLFEALPASLKDPNGPAPTLDEILQLPLRSFSTGIGNPTLPGPYNFDEASQNHRFRFYVQDAWSLRPSLTVSAGLAYSFDTNLFHHDLDYPSYLAPIVGNDLRPPRRDLDDFDPSAGIAWTVGQSRRTVVRSGVGLYHDESSLFWKARDRAFVGPSGNGRVVVEGSVTPFDFTSTPTAFRGQDLVAALPGIRADLASRFGNGTDLAVRGIEVIKQGDQIVDPASTTASSLHVNAGVQTELRPNLVLTADYVLRRYGDVGALQGVYALDRNRFNRPRVTSVNPDTGVVSFVRDPVIPLCSPEQARALSAADVCSTGPINVFASKATFLYQGLHLTLERRLTDGAQFTMSYALSRNTGFIDGGFTSFDDADLAYGNIPDHRRHRLIVSGTWMPPTFTGSSRLWRGLLNAWTLSFVAHHYSAPPLDTVLAGLDLDGDGISQTLLPGTTRHNTFGQGLDASGLRALVAQYNEGVDAATRRVTNPDGTVTIVRPRTPFNQIITPIVLPETFSNGDAFHTFDLRITKTIGVGGRARLSLIGEVFNLFNIANLTGYSGVINQPNYGQPSARIGQVFGTGGPRAGQLAARVGF